MDLREWLIQYVRHKDILEKSLKEVKKGDPILFIYKDRELEGYVMEDLSVPSTKNHAIVATLQKESNINYLIEHWDEFLLPGLTIVFVNPEENERWAIRPTAHAQIAGDNIEAGIRSLASNVPIF